MAESRKWLKVLIVVAALGIVLAAVSAVVLYWYFSRDLPPLYSLKDYRPNIITQIYADDGSLIGEYAEERRKIVPLERVPQYLIDAIVITEDARFFKHEGLDYIRIAGAAWEDIKAGGKPKEGASTITMQVARSFFFTKRKLLSRKIKEAILATRIERYLTKDEILFLYLNQIWMGRRSYGVQVAAENYFGKDISEVTLAEAAVLAALPRAPARYSPVNHPDKCKARQKLVLDIMVQAGKITEEEAEEAYAEPLRIVEIPNLSATETPYFTEHVRRYLVETYGEERVLLDGLQVFTTCNLKLQRAAQEAVRRGIDGPKGLDKRQGYRGPLRNLETEDDRVKFLEESEEKLAAAWVREHKKNPGADAESKRPEKIPLEVGEEYEALVTSINNKKKLVYLKVGRSEGYMSLEDMAWARKPNPDVPPEWIKLKSPSQALNVGDVILARVKEAVIEKDRSYYRFALEQDPLSQAGLLAFSVRTGEVKALIGGYDFFQSQLIRPVQSARQPGSSFKPINYAAALAHPMRSYTTATVILDSPVVFDHALPQDDDRDDTTWRPDNFSETFSGPCTFHQALAKSINMISIKILDDIGVGYSRKFAKKMGIKSPMPKDLSIALGSSPVTLVEICRAYNVFASGGYMVEPIYIRRIYDRDGNLLEYMEGSEPEVAAPASVNPGDEIKEEDLLGEEMEEEVAPASPVIPQPVSPEEEGELRFEEYLAELRDGLIPSIPPVGTPVRGPRVMDPQTAYLMTSLLKGVVQYGTGWRAKSLGWPLAGKTGTTNDFKDAWFLGYSPEIICGVWVGFDDFSKSLGRYETGSKAALPIWMEFMQKALEGKSPIDFPQPPGIEFANIDNETGLLAGPCSTSTSFLAFKAGTVPTETTSCSTERIHSDLLRSLDY